MATNTGYIEFNEQAEPSAPAAGKQRLYIDSTSHKLKRTDSSGTDVTIEGASVATDTIWDTAGDIAVASGADAASKLAIGNVGGALRRINGALGYDSRTSFPTAATGDVIYRSDLSGQWYYDGTRWLSLAASQVSIPFAIVPPFSATGVGHRVAIPQGLGGSDIYLATVTGAYFVDAGTALGASHKWVATVSKTAGATSTSLGTISIASGSSSQWLGTTGLAINAAAAVGSGYVAIEINWVKTGTPGPLYCNLTLSFRTIAT